MGPTMAPGPTMFPTVFVPDPDCTDYAGFIDDFDDDCAWYSENEDPGCRDEGDTVGGFGFVNVTANEACVSMTGVLNYSLVGALRFAQPMILPLFRIP